MKFSSRLLNILMITSLLLLVSGVQPVRASTSAIPVPFSAGSLIIPMDIDPNGQDMGMLRAYGLVYELLRNNVTVHWAILAGKPANGADFTISSVGNTVESIRTSTAIPLPRSYRGGPFIISSTDAAIALPIIQAWQATAGDNTEVHELTSGSITPDIAQTLINAPRIAILQDGNETTAFNNLNAASISDSAGGTWGYSSPDLLTESQVVGPTTSDDADGALLYQPSDLARYCYIASMHYNPNITTTEVVQEVRSWLTGTSFTHAYMQCESIVTFESDPSGLFLTTAGLRDDGNLASNPQNRFPSNPLSQIDGTFEVDNGAVDSIGLRSGSNFKTGAQTLFNEVPNFVQRITLLTGNMDGALAGNGKVTYLAGHDYTVSLPISSNQQANGVRIFLNSIFASGCATSPSQADIVLTLSAPATINNSTIIYTVNYTNPGPRPVEQVSITNVLPLGTTYINGSATITPTSTSSNTLIWDLPSLASGESGSFTFSVSVTTDGAYDNTASIQFAHLTVHNISSNTVTTEREISTSTSDSDLIASSLPDTGFAPYKITPLPVQPAELAYTAMSDIWLEIPSQNIKTDIVGIPQSENQTWDVTWLGNDTGWLHGTAFPTWNGNSVLTAHVTDSNGLPGPFSNIKELKYGDQIIVHLFDQQYIFEIQNSRMARPYTANFAFASLQDHSYLTLITCQGYIPLSDIYIFRRIVRAVLVEVK